MLGHVVFEEGRLCCLLSARHCRDGNPDQPVQLTPRALPNSHGEQRFERKSEFPALVVSVGAPSPAFVLQQRDTRQHLCQTHDGAEGSARGKPRFLIVAPSCSLFRIFHVFQALCRIRAIRNYCQENRKVRLKLPEFSFLPINPPQQLIFYLEKENKAQKTCEQPGWVVKGPDLLSEM